MSFQISQGESFSDGIRRILLEESDNILTRLADTSDPDVSIHESRKSIKKMRATLRLISDEMSRSTFNRENKALRNCGRRLSEIRDLKAMFDTLTQIQAEQKDKQVIKTLGLVREDIATRLTQSRESLYGPEGLLALVQTEVQAVRERLETLKLKRKNAFDKGIERTFRLGKKAMSKAFRESETHQMHQWRKRVKDLWYQTTLLTDAWPAIMSVYTQELRQLSESLGSDHDLAVLQERLDQLEVSTPAQGTAREKLKVWIEGRRTDLHQQALDIAARIYLSNPSLFAKDLRKRWKLRPVQLAEVAAA